MNERRKDWIYILTPDGKKLIAGPDYIKKLLGLQDVDSPTFRKMYSRIRDLEDIVDDLEKPLRQQKILELLKDDGGFHTQQWITVRIARARCLDITSLESEGKLKRKKSGNHVLFGINGEAVSAESEAKK